MALRTHDTSQWLAAIRLAPAAIAIVLVLAAWEVYADLSSIRANVLPPPSRIFEQMLEQKGPLIENAIPTIEATLSGFALSVCSAFLLSIMVDFFDVLKRALYPLFIVSQTLPLVAIAPLVVLWFGFGLLPKILLVAFVTFFPMLVALVQGYASTDGEIEQLLRSMGATRSQIFTFARLPSALPYLFAGVRVSITYAVVGAIFGEYAGAAKGLGIYILNAKNNFRPDLVLAAVALSALLTLSLFALTVLMQRFVMPWERAERETSK
jgi:ABC-type nitrate/sulfonate/bicarbonate transport system permease component